MSTADEARAEAFHNGWDARNSEVADLTAQLQAAQREVAKTDAAFAALKQQHAASDVALIDAQATIAEVRNSAQDGLAECDDDCDMSALWVSETLSRADTSALAEHDRQVAEGAWDEGKSYEIEYPSGDEDSDGNPFRAPIEQTEANRG